MSCRGGRDDTPNNVGGQLELKTEYQLHADAAPNDLPRAVTRARMCQYADYTDKASDAPIGTIRTDGPSIPTPTWPAIYQKNAPNQ